MLPSNSVVVHHRCCMTHHGFSATPAPVLGSNAEWVPRHSIVIQRRSWLPASYASESEVARNPTRIPTSEQLKSHPSRS